MVNTGEIVNAFARFFTAGGWEYSHNAASRYLKASNKEIPHIPLTVVYQENGFAVFFHLPYSLAAETKAEALEYITRVNLNTDIGTFKADLSDGSLVFTSYTNTTDLSSVPDAFVSQAVLISLSLLLQFSPGLHEVIVGRLDAETAYQRILAAAE